MTHGLTFELVLQANTIARRYHPHFYCSAHELVADLTKPGFPTGPPHVRRAVKVYFPTDTDTVQLLYCESEGDDEVLLTALQKALDTWAATDTPPEDLHWISEARAAQLLQLVTHSLTTAADRTALLGKYLRWQTEKDARDLMADLTAKIEARSPGVLTGRGWMPHGKAEPRPSPPLAA